MSGRVPPRILVATSNPGKLHEIRTILAAQPVLWLGLDEVDPVSFPDEGDEYGLNACGKARAACDATGLPAVADDSGLEVAGLQGGPGARSARFGGPGLDDAARAAKLLEALEGLEGAARQARFVCVAALAMPDGELRSARGECDGRILHAPTGHNGFGYDPVFAPEGRSCSMAELSEREKNRISHRARAFRALFPPRPAPPS